MEMADEFGITFLASLPFDVKARENANKAIPFVITDPKTEISRKFIKIYSKIEAKKMR
jgi:MinD-like ATPase involved in chromosome partitioning or flagellar assembly